MMLRQIIYLTEVEFIDIRYIINKSYLIRNYRNISIQ